MQRPSPSVSVPSLPGVLSASGPRPSTPIEQSSHESASASSQTVGSVVFASEPSRTPSLSSSRSPTLQRPSLSVSVPSFAGVLSGIGPKPSTPIAQSSHRSVSVSPHSIGSSGSGSGPSSTPSLSSSGSVLSRRPSPSVSTVTDTVST